MSRWDTDFISFIQLALLRKENSQLASERDKWRDEQQRGAKTIASLQGEVSELKVEISALLKECEQLRFNHSTCDETILNLRDSLARKTDEYDLLRCLGCIAAAAVAAGDCQLEICMLTDSYWWSPFSERSTRRATTLSHPYESRFLILNRKSSFQSVKGRSAQLLGFNFHLAHRQLKRPLIPGLWWAWD